MQGQINKYDDEQDNVLRSDEGDEAPRDEERPGHMRNLAWMPAPSKGTDVKPAGY